MRYLPIAAVLLAACHAEPSMPARGSTPGDRLEAAAEAAGVVRDPASVELAGLYARDTDRLCLVRSGDDAYRIGASINYDGGQGCAASGTATRAGGRLDVSMGECRFAARFEGDRVRFPAEMPRACDAACTGHTTLAALDVERVSDSTAEAAALRGPKGRALCDPR